MSDDDEKKRAGVLDTLSFALLDQPALVKKLAAMFIRAEDSIKDGLGRRARNNWEVRDRTVGPWLRTVYTPTRGAVATTIKEVVAEIERQQDVRKKRTDNIAYRAIVTRSLKIEDRRNRVAASLYKILVKNYRNEMESVPHTCAFVTSYGEWLVAVNTGGYYRDTYLFIRNRRTGRSSLVSLGINYTLRSGSLYDVLYDLSSERTKAALFQGAAATVNFDTLEIYVGGEIQPIKNKGAVATSENGKLVVFEIK